MAGYGAGTGIQMKVEPVGKKWMWEVKRFSARLGRDLAETEEAATAAMTLFVAKVLAGQHATGRTRSTWKLKLYGYAEKRPFAVAHVASMTGEQGATKERVVDEAAEGETQLHDTVTGEEFTLHPMSPGHRDMAAKVYDAMVGAGLIEEEKDDEGKVVGTNGKKALAWAQKKLGPAVFGGGPDELTASVMAKAKALVAKGAAKGASAVKAKRKK